MVDICERIHCKKLHISDIEISFVERDIKQQNIIKLDLDLNNTGLVSDGCGNIVTAPLPHVNHDYGVITSSVDMFQETDELMINYNKSFNNPPKIFLTPLFIPNDRYSGIEINEINTFSFKANVNFKANKINKINIKGLETNKINLYYSGYGIIVRNNDNSLYFINNQSFDGSGKYRYHLITKDEVDPLFSSILSVDGYPMIAYSRKSNSNLILGVCNSMTGLGQWTFSTNNSIGVYPNLIVTETRRIAIINYDGDALLSSVIDDGIWYSHRIDKYNINDVKAISIDKYNIMVATRSDQASGCRIYIGKPSGEEWKLSFSSTNIWLSIDLGMFADNRPVVITNSLDGIRLYYNTIPNGTGIWNSVKLSDESVIELKYLLLGNGDSAIFYRLNDGLYFIHLDVLTFEFTKTYLGPISNISVNNTHNGYINIVGIKDDELVSIISAYKYRFADDIKEYQIYWYTEDVRR